MSSSPNVSSSISNSNSTSPSTSVWPVFRPFVIAAITGLTSITIFQPIDTIKVRIQIAGDTINPNASTTKSNFYTVGRDIFKNEGFQAFYKGLTAQYTRQLTYGMFRLGIFRLLTNHFTPEGGEPSDIDFSTRAMCAVTAGGISATIGTPAEAALVRMQSDAALPIEQRRGYRNVIDAFTRMIREEGLINGCFAGATPTISRAMIMNFGLLTSYDSIFGRLKPYFVKNDDSDEKKSMQAQKVRFLSGFLSGMCGATITLPFDFLKTRMQKQVRLEDGTYPYKNVIDCAMKVAKSEGIGRFYVGYTTFVIRIAPIVTFQWILMDNLKIMFAKRGL